MFGVGFIQTGKMRLLALTVAVLETTRCYPGTGVECRLIVKAHSKLFFVSLVGAKLTALQDECPLELV